jgi:succinate dehydrogenase/fumarate reductase flavoprotein subunit
VGHAAWNAIVQGDGIDYLEDAWFLDVVTETSSEGPIVVGGLIYEATEGCLVAVQAPAVVLAAGGLSTLYFPNTDTMRGNTGDSYALAARAGAELVDMEQVQFLPFCLTAPPSYEGLLAGEPVTAGYLGVIRGANGKVILDGVMLRTRAECSAAMVEAVENGNGTDRGGCYLDLTANVKGQRSAKYYIKFLHTSLSGVMVTVRQALGRNAVECKETWEVRPGAHYCMGGVRVDAKGRAYGAENRNQVGGLFAAGQAMGGVFGGNRLGSTSLAEGPIFGARAGREAAQLCKPNTDSSVERLSEMFQKSLQRYRKVFGQEGEKSGSGMIRELQRAAWVGIGPARTQSGLEKFLGQLASLRADAAKIAVNTDSVWNQSFIDYVEFLNMLDTAESVAVSALNRADSLGAHIRMDGGKTSVLFGKPYSVAVLRENTGAFTAHKLDRNSTPWRKLLVHAYHDRKRKLGMKILRVLPLALQDRYVEKKFRTFMGPLDSEKSTGDSGTAVGEELEAA